MNLAIFTNILNPYRIAFFDRLYSNTKDMGYELRVYAMVGEKSDRPWKYEQFEREYTRLLPSKTLHIKDMAYLHFNSGIDKELNDFRPDVVVMAGSYLQPTNMYLQFRKRHYGYKTFFWTESHFAEMRNYGNLKLKLREIIRRQTISRMDGFWYPGKKAEEFVNHYMKPTAYKIMVPNTIDNTFFRQELLNEQEVNDLREKIAAGHRKIIFTPARLSKEKGILEFCEILKHIDNRKYVWIIAGEGDLRSLIEAKVEEYNLSLKLVGQKNQNEIRNYYAACDFFLLPSISDPNPLTSVEALWMRKPLFLSTCVGNYPETVVEDKNGFIFSYSDCYNAIDKLNQLLSKDEDWYINAGDISYSKATQLFCLNSVAKNALICTSNCLNKDAHN